MNVLVVHELYDEEVVEVYQLSNDQQKAQKQARQMFLTDVAIEKSENGFVDEDSTYWDDFGQFGQIVWRDGRRATYHVTYTIEWQKGKYGSRM